MTKDLDNTFENQDMERVDKVARKPLMLFKTMGTTYQCCGNGRNSKIDMVF